MFASKTLLITGGTGSFGNAVLSRFLRSEIGEIRIFSRDEKKQDEQRSKFQDERVRYYIGDTRDLGSISNAMRGVNFVFHAAALKQVPSCEFFPLEAVKTNILGTENVLNAAIKAEVERVICLSTDKAVYPINAMGMSKALMEKVAVATALRTGDIKTTICTTRYGNVMGSRGSVIPRLIGQIRSGVPLTITDPHMTRFMMTLDDAIDLVLYAFRNGKSGDIFIQKSPAATIDTLKEAIKEILGAPDYPEEIIGTRHGEKLYEVLLSREEMSVASDLGGYYRIGPDDRSLNYEKFMSKGSLQISEAVEYTSHNTDRLDVKSLVGLLHRVEFVSQYIGGKSFEILDT